MITFYQLGLYEYISIFNTIITKDGEINNKKSRVELINIKKGDKIEVIGFDKEFIVIKLKNHNDEIVRINKTQLNSNFYKSLDGYPEAPEPGGVQCY